MSVELHPQTLERLRGVSSNTASGLLIKIAGLRTRAVAHVRPVTPQYCRFVGPAFTVRCVPIREDLTERSSLASPGGHLHGTLDKIPAGAVLMIDMMRDDSCGVLGDVLVAGLCAHGVAGIVADGGMRDGEAISGIPIPVFSNGITPPPSGRALFAADVQTVIGCGGVMVVPDDIVLGDADGVVVIPRHLADEVAVKGLEQEAIELFVRRKIELGAPISGLYPPREEAKALYQAWVDQGRPELK